MPLSDVTFADVERLASSQAEEGPRLELKRELSANTGQRDPWMAGNRRIGNPAKDDLAKEIVANAYGG
ncbi:MAG TPA: ATP-binding protein, partial [Beijerinckiaceae bacterium]|nr:ATP-binding protein [Beijerinckiaceae bacterium]